MHNYLQSAIAHRVITGLYSGVTTAELDNIAAETAASMINEHPDYNILAARIAISNLHKETKKVFSGKILQYHVSFLSYIQPISVFLLFATCRCDNTIVSWESFNYE